MHELLTFAGDHPVLTFSIIVVLVIAVLAHLSERLDRKYGERF